MVVQLRGTSGSGKTYAVRAILNHFKPQPDRNEDGKILGYELDNGQTRLYVVGDYDSSECGGCDKIKRQKEIRQRVQAAALAGRHVLFEGLLASGSVLPYAFLATELERAGHDYRFILLDTPLETCLDRIRSRRERKGNKKPLNPTNTTKSWNNQRRHYQKLREFGLDVRRLSGDEAIEQVIRWFSQGAPREEV